MTTEHHCCAAGVSDPLPICRLRFHQTLLLKKTRKKLTSSGIYSACPLRRSSPSPRSFLALHIGGSRADPAAQGTDSSSSQLSSNFLCRSGILLKHGGATEEDGCVDVADESAGGGEWLAGGKAWGYRKPFLCCDLAI